MVRIMDETILNSLALCANSMLTPRSSTIPARTWYRMLPLLAMYTPCATEIPSTSCDISMPSTWLSKKLRTATRTLMTPTPKREDTKPTTNSKIPFMIMDAHRCAMLYWWLPFWLTWESRTTRLSCVMPRAWPVRVCKQLQQKMLQLRAAYEQAHLLRWRQTVIAIWCHVMLCIRCSTKHMTWLPGTRYQGILQASV